MDALRGEGYAPPTQGMVRPASDKATEAVQLVRAHLLQPLALAPRLFRAPSQVLFGLTPRELGGVSSFGYSGTIAHALFMVSTMQVSLASDTAQFRRSRFPWSTVRGRLRPVWHD